MKNKLKLLSVIASAAAMICCISLPAAQAASVPYGSSIISDNQYAQHRYDTVSDAAAAIRAKLCAHEEEFNIPVTLDMASTNEKIDSIIAAVFIETDSPEEGDYLRYSLDEYRYSTSPDWFSDLTVINFTWKYNTTAEQEKLLDSKVKSILDKLNVYNASDYEKIYAVYNYVVKNTSYSKEYTDNTIFSAYSAAINGHAVCQGYSQLIYRLLRELKVSCRIIPGASGDVNHAWNIAAIGDTYYFLDATWESQLKSKRYVFFLRGYDDFDTLADIDNKHSFTPASHNPSPLSEELDKGILLSQYNISKTAYDPNRTYAKGDVDGNGKTDAADATMILQAYSALSTGKALNFSANQARSADVDGDSAITSSDATYVLMYYSYLATTVNPVDIDTFVSGQS